MTGSGEKHAQDKNLIWCILVALRPILLLTVYINTLYVDIYTVQVCSSDGGASVDYADLAKLLTSKTRSITDDVTSAGQ